MTTQGSAKESEIGQLAELQKVDRQLKAQQDRVDALIGEADECESQLAAQRAEMARMGAERKTLDSQRRDLEARADVEGDRIRDSRMRMNNVRSDREVLALQRQVEIGRAANQQLEEELFVILERLEALDAEMKETADAVKDLEEKAKTVVVERRSEAQSLEGDLLATRARRDALADEIDPGLRSKYDMLFHNRGGTAVVEVRQGTCLGCHMNIPPQLFNEVQRLRDVHQCPNCHRILFWRPESPDGSGVEAG